MKTIWLLVAMIFVAPAWAEGPAAPSGDEQTIRQLYAQYDAAWNKGDVAALTTAWADDADHVEPDGRAIKGRAALEKELGQRFATDLKGTHSQQTITAVRFVTPDVALVDASYEVTGIRNPQGQPAPALKGRYLDVWAKRTGKWQIVADRPVVPAPAAK